MLTSGLHGGKRTDWHFHSNFGTSEQSLHDEESCPIHWSRIWYADCLQRITSESVGQIKIRDQGALCENFRRCRSQTSTGVYADCQGHDLHSLKKECSIAHDSCRKSLQNRLRDPMLLKGHRRRTARGRYGWQPKSLATASGKGNQPAGRLPESNHGCPGPSDIMRGKADQNQHSQSQPG